MLVRASWIETDVTEAFLEDAVVDAREGIVD